MDLIDKDGNRYQHVFYLDLEQATKKIIAFDKKMKALKEQQDEKKHTEWFYRLLELSEESHHTIPSGLTREERHEWAKEAFVTIEEARERRDYKKFEKPLAKDKLKKV